MLTGAWATGPSLHNGSEPTIHEVLSPPAERRAVFWAGGREFDPEWLGFAAGDAPGRFRFDTSLRGNRNTGHEYPRQGLTPDERLAVIEFLKTLQVWRWGMRLPVHARLRSRPVRPGVRPACRLRNSKISWRRGRQTSPM